ncbi:MAG: L-threonylcarbamoyladenylate synthase, partial [Pirellulales bacterium]
ESVDRIFQAKGRPATNPLIVHVADKEMAKTLAADWPDTADAIASHFWPGPVTIVVPKKKVVPDNVTAGGSTVALRCPDHRIMQWIIKHSGYPLAAPSANRSEALSPTCASHVLESLRHRVDLILDGGPCIHGIESTVIDCTTTPSRILRPGPIDREHLESVLSETVTLNIQPHELLHQKTSRSPGLHSRHYAPKTPLELSKDAVSRVKELLNTGKRIAWMTSQVNDPAIRSLASSHDVLVIPVPDTPSAFAAMLYATLHALDQRELDRIICDYPPETDSWAAILDRLSKAATEVNF